MSDGVGPAGVPASNGLIHAATTLSVDEAFRGLEATASMRGVNIFARIDFTADAHTAGLEMQEAKMLVFGNPKAGTPVMLASPTAAIDLPLKVLVWRDTHGDVWLTYNDPEYLRERHGIPPSLAQNISGIGNLVAASSEMEIAA